MAMDRNTVDLTANGGGEASATGNVKLWTPPTSPTSRVLHCVVKKITITNRTGASGEVLIDDLAAASTAISTVAPFATEITTTQAQAWTQDDFGEWIVTNGLVVQASNAATSNGYKVSVEVDVR